MSSPAPRSVQRILDRLENPRRSGTGWLAKCPAHEDSQPSLTVGIGRDDRALLTCHRGCDVKDVLTALDLSTQDLFAEQKQESSRRDELVATYDYVDAQGELVFQVLRFRQSDGRKTFRQRRPDGRGGWSWSLGDVERPLFRLPQILDAIRAGNVIWVVEGEKDVLSLERLGLAATCNSGGAGKWLDNHTATLKDAKVVIVADNDNVGRTHATRIRTALTAAGARVKMGVPPEGHKDITDMIQAGLGVGDLLPFDGENSPAPTPLAPEPESPGPDEWSALLDRLRGYDSELPLEDRVRLARKELGLLIPAQVINPGRVVPWVDFIDESADDTYDWLIPGLIEREERVMIVAAEGVGKSVLARQVALLSGSGVHPFTYSRMDPIRTLFIDLENPERIIRRASRKMVGSLRQMFEGRLTTTADLWTKPDGLNVLREGDRALLEERLDAFRPDLVVFGPLYKFYLDPGGRTAEAVAIEVASYLDFLRTTYGCALWIEHHAPLGNALSGRELRPMGSAVWLRWPEFGYSLAQDPAAVVREYVVKQWRGPRDERVWPVRMVRGSVFPWEVVEWSSPGL